MNDKPFSCMDQKSAHFYRQVFMKAMLNLHAVRMGYFDTLLCETEDPRVSSRWDETLPKITSIMRQRAADDQRDNER